VTTGLPADSDNVTDGSQISAKLRWEFAPENTGYRSALSAHYRKDDNDNTESGADTGGTTGERIELNWTGFYTMDNWDFAGGVEYLQRLFTQRGPIAFGDPNQKQHDNTYSVFAETNGQLTESLTATLSARFDNNSEFDNAVSYRGGLTGSLTITTLFLPAMVKLLKPPPSPSALATSLQASSATQT